MQSQSALQTVYPNKVRKIWSKGFKLAESTTGYVLSSKIYAGKENNELQIDLGRKAVMSVLQPYLDKGLYAFMDNYYSSVGKFKSLKNDARNS